MATFQFSDHPGVDLDFCGKLNFRLPLDGDTAKRLKSAGQYLMDKSKPTGGETLEGLCDYVMDAIDEVLGEGAAEQIEALKPGFDFWDALDVFKHISDEFNAAVGNAANRFKPAPAAPSNRAQRRAEARARVAVIHSRA